MRFLPVGLDVRGRSCVVVGGGAVGARKARSLARAGARVTVVSPVVNRDLARDIAADRVLWVREPFAERHLEGAWLVVMATDDGAVNAAGVEIAARGHALACDASSALRSTVVFGAHLEDEGVTIATFTGGRSPAKAKKKRDEIARLLEETKTR
jgi:siroheme synthase-like protein